MTTSVTREGPGHLRFQDAEIEQFVIDYGLQIEVRLDKDFCSPDR